MSTRTRFGVAVLVGGAVAGCAADPADEPIVVMGSVHCVDAASLLGLDLGNREIELAPPVDRAPLDQVEPHDFTLRPFDGRVALEWAGDLGVHAVILERVVGRSVELDDVAPTAVTLTPRDDRAHVEAAGELGIHGTALAPRVEVYLRDPAQVGPVVLPVSQHPRTKWPHDLLTLRVCVDER